MIFVVNNLSDQIMFDIYFKGAGKFVGLDLLLSPDANDYVSYHESYYGIEASIHNRHDFPDSGHFFSLLPGYNVDIYLTPTVIKSDDSVRSLDVSQRNCLFEDEVNRRKKYRNTIEKSTVNSFPKCTFRRACLWAISTRTSRVWSIVVLEVLSSIVAAFHSTIRMPVGQTLLLFWNTNCNILKYWIFSSVFFTVLPEFSNISVCGYLKSECLRKLRTMLSSTEPPADSPAFEYSTNGTEIGMNCNCIPGCDEVRYQPSIHLANLLSSPFLDRPNALVPKL